MDQSRADIICQTLSGYADNRKAQELDASSDDLERIILSLPELDKSLTGLACSGTEDGFIADGRWFYESSTGWRSMPVYATKQHALYNKPVLYHVTGVQVEWVDNTHLGHGVYEAEIVRGIRPQCPIQSKQSKE